MLEAVIQNLTDFLKKLSHIMDLTNVVADMCGVVGTIVEEF